MGSRLWIIYCVACLIMVMYLYWTMNAVTFEPRYRICQPGIKGCENDIQRRVSYNIGEPHQNLNQTKVVTFQKGANCSTIFPPTMVNGTNINSDITKFFTMRKKEIKDSFVNLHKYKFTANSKICSERELFLIMVVHSSTTYYRKRTIIRTTFGSVHSYRGKQFGVVFLLGRALNASIQDSINSEIKLYGDIVQGNFPDTYKNLIRKHVMAMHWFKYHCDAEYILKLDDDTFVNPFRTVEYLLRAKPQGLTIHCKVILEGDPMRNNRSKWYTPMSQYPFSVFPPFCIGFAYITTPETWAAMYVASKSNRKMDMDDVYVSVVLAMKTKVQKTDFDQILYQCPKNMSDITMQNLNKKAIFIDRKGRCREKPFLWWNTIRHLNA